MDGLQELLADGTRYAPQYLPSNNSDHLPMTLCAIAGLGGDYDTAVAYRDDYQKILHEIPNDPALSDWRRGIGRRQSYPALFAWFREQVARQGIESSVAEYLPEFVSSLTMDAFHPVIRLGYAIDFGSEAETAAALAYIISAHRDVPVSVERVVDLRQRMRAQAAARSSALESTGFTRRILELLALDEYPVGRAGDMGECATTALDVYRSTRNFFALHMVTATQAVRICAGLIDDKLAVAALTGGLLAAHRVVESPQFSTDHPLAVPPRLDREHTYKYAWSCLSEYRHYGDSRYAEEVRGFRDAGLIPEWCAKSEV